MRTLSRRFFLTLCSGFFLLPLHAEDERPIEKDGSKEIAAASHLPTLWIAGDSTLKSNAPMRGWGQDLGSFFDPAKINVVNRAIGGRSSRTFFTEGRWQAILDEAKNGDFILIQFGHNDVGPLDERGKFRGSLKGTGPETETVTKPDGSLEIVHTYGWYLREMVRTAKEKHAQVILCSPIPQKKFDDSGNFVSGWQDYGIWAEAVAKEQGAIYINLTEIITRQYEKLDRATIENFFADARTHTNAEGARFNAKAVISGIREIPAAPLDAYLNEQGLEIKKP